MNKFQVFFVDQATPRFELGIKDLQSPALPLGHAAKFHPNPKYIKFLSIFLDSIPLLVFIWIFSFLIIFFFFLDLESHCTYPFTKKDFLFFLRSFLYSFIRLIFSQNTRRLKMYLLFSLFYRFNRSIEKWKDSRPPVTDAGQIKIIHFLLH